MREQSRIEQINEITGGDFELSSSSENGCLFRLGLLPGGAPITIQGGLDRGHLGRFKLQLTAHRLDQALDNWLAAARAIQGAFEDTPRTEPSPPENNLDAEADAT